QSHGGAAAQGHRARLLMDDDSHYVAQPADRYGEAQDQRNGQPLFFHLHVRLAGKVFQPGRLSAPAMSANSGTTTCRSRRNHWARLRKAAHSEASCPLIGFFLIRWLMVHNIRFLVWTSIYGWNGVGDFLANNS